MTAKIWQPCTSCASERASGDWASAVSCRECDGKGAVRVRESWVCNKCGGCMCPSTPEGNPNGDVPHGLVDAKVSGGCDSPALSDCATYKFSICEPCLRALFDSFKVPPIVGEYMLGGGGEVDNAEAYAEEAASLRAANERQEARLAKQKGLEARNLCTASVRDANDNPTDDFCEQRAVLVASSGKWSWPLCEHHANDVYASHAMDAIGMTFAERGEIGMRYLAAFMRGESLRAANEYERHIFISTLFPLVARPETWAFASSELARLSRAFPLRCGVWTSHRVVGNFPPGARGAVEANDWLAWGKAAGYGNAVACAHLGHDAAEMWAWGRSDVEEPSAEAVASVVESDPGAK